VVHLGGNEPVPGRSGQEEEEKAELRRVAGYTTLNNEKLEQQKYLGQDEHTKLPLSYGDAPGLYALVDSDLHDALEARLPQQLAEHGSRV
jgi:hypothetical protein